MVRALLLVFLIGVFFACKQDIPESPIMLPLSPTMTHLSGQLEGYKFNGNNEFLSVQVMNFRTFDYDRKLVRVDSMGNFSAAFPMDHQQDVMVIHDDGNFTMILSPGDSAYLVLQADEFSEREPGPQNIQITGASAETNRILWKYLPALKADGPLGIMDTAMKKMTAEEFTPKLTAIMERQQTFLKDYIRDNNITDVDFIDWSRNAIRYQIMKNFADFRMFLPLSQGIQPNEYPFPEDYGAFVQLIDESDRGTMMASAYARFLRNYYNYLQQEVEADLKKMDGYKPNPLTRSRALLHRVEEQHQGYAREALLSRVMVERLKRNMADSIKQELYDIYLEVAEDDYFRSYVSEEYSNLFQDAPGMWELEENISTLELPDLAGKEVSEIFAAYRGKILYLDFWATWCKPCLTEFSFYPKIIESVDTSQVAFVFLASSSPAGHWLKTVDKFQLPGDHYLLSRQEFLHFKTLLNIRGFPHHVLIGKNGEILDDQALRPLNSSMQPNVGLIATINQLLEDS